MIILDGKTDTELGIRVLNSYEQQEPATNDRTIEIPGRNGEYDYGANLGARSFNLPIMIERQQTKLALNQKISDLKQILLDPLGRPRYFKLAFDDEPEKYYNVRYSGAYSINKLLTLARFVLPLKAFDPASYAHHRAYEKPIYYDENINYEEDGVIFINPEGFNWFTQRHMSCLFNYSYFSTSLALRIEGAVTNPKVTNETTGEVHYLPSIVDGDILEVDGSSFLVKKNGQNALNETDGNFITLTSGKNDLIFEGTGANCSVFFTWKHKFL